MQNRKPFNGTQGVANPSGKSLASSRSESCVVLGQPTLRSVDSECRSRVIEPRKFPSPKPSHWFPAGATPTHRKGLMRRFGRGRRARAKAQEGSPETWESLSFPQSMSRMEPPGDQLQACRSAHGGDRRHEKSRVQRWYRQAKETKCGETNDRQSQRPRSTVELGEARPRQPEGGKEKPIGGVRLRDRRRET